ncbi:CHASE2 domain-containing protein [Lichenifustis flavocetrariae]|uniref:Adenylate/guanylate cyclase domain-containing protein n=1 Tax=Lichenifustis flavocetrariae TaxID=2949735 RepID=A0AA41YVK5_9HYPH|nr:adenylate/guanylate cyclase domain-containing protein [Lichenifustis flavocetrariae]MCW6509366.1 adenylate/guanylate cyclase domain-containing protein [Lichenifustis flavocetrariae]
MRRLLFGTSVLLAVAWSAFLDVGHLAGQATVLDRLESSLLDLRILAFGRRPAPGSMLIIAIDDAMARRAGRFPVPRSQVAEIVRWSLAHGASAVALDMLFLDLGSPADDDALAQVLGQGKTVVAAMADYSTDPSKPACQRAIAVLARASASGIVNISLDRSGVVRYAPALLSCGDTLLPSLAVRSVSLAAQADPSFQRDAVTIGRVSSALDMGRHIALRYYGPQGSIPTVSANDILDGTSTPDIRGKIVLVGVTASGAGDTYATPFDSVLPGVEVLATSIANLQSGDTLVRTTVTRRIDAGVATGLALGGAICLSMGNIGVALVLLAALVTTWLVFVFVSFGHGIWFAMAIPLAALAPVAVLAGAGRLMLDRLTQGRLQRQQDALSVFHAPAMRAKLADNPDYLARPEERDIAVIFIDLSGFTGLSERLGHQQARDLLEQWHAIVETAAAEGGGLVASFMGDGAMIVWGMTGSGADDAARALQTAAILQARTLQWLETVAAQTGTLGIKLGGHYGPAILSRLGHRTHQHITAIGDTVNVAARLMEVAAEFNSTIAVSALLLSTAHAQGWEGANFGRPKSTDIRGRGHPLDVCLWSEMAAPRSSEDVG